MLEFLVLGLDGKCRQPDNRPAFQRGIVRAQADAGPVGGLFGVRKRVPVFDQCGEELVDQVRVRAAMARALGEAEMRFLAQIIDAFGRKPANRRGQELCVVGRFDFFGDLRFGQLRRP